jgi:uncharacterized membrane protein YfcA
MSALMIGLAKTGTPGVGTLVSPLMVFTAGDARYAAAWTTPLLSVGDIFALFYWGRHADSRKLFSLVPWVLVGMAGGALALSLSELVLRRIIGMIVLVMLVLYVIQRRHPGQKVGGNPPFYGIAAGFATTVANAAGPVMNMYLLSHKLPKERFVATGAWFFFVVNLAKIPIYIGYRLFTPASLTFDLMMVPAVVAGALIGFQVIRRIPQRVFDSLVVILTAVSALFLFR